MALVIDASAAVQAALSEVELHRIVGEDLVAPALMWSEGLSAIHELAWRREISGELADIARRRLTSFPVRLRRPDRRLSREAWSIAETLGWAKTYDAEYVALARLLECPLLTVDARLKRGASRLVKVVGPADL